MSTKVAAVDTAPAPIEPFRGLLEQPEWAAFTQTMAQAAKALDGRRIWNINSTAQGGGVAEMLGWQIPYELGVGMDVRWLVIEGDASFFAFTKRLHALLHGASADGSTITDAERKRYDDTIAGNATKVLAEVRAGDVAIVHDPQPAGLIPHLQKAGLKVVWRCHIGVDQPNEAVREVWQFLHPAVSLAQACVFSRRAYIWDGLDQRKVTIIPPAIDAFTAKNQDLTSEATVAILRATGILDGTGRGDPFFRASNGSQRRVERATSLTPQAVIPTNAPLIVQVSRWDRLKDPTGVIDGFATYIAPAVEGYLVLAGPGATAVADDPEEAAVFQEVEGTLRQLPEAASRRIRLARLPMDDAEENAAIVNALQRRANVVVQKSLAEGFGLTVAEAMWKARPVVASRVGGISDQIEDGANGLLIEPRDLKSFGTAVRGLLDDRTRAERLGAAARTRVRRQFLAPRLLMQQARLVTSLLQ